MDKFDANKCTVQQINAEIAENAHFMYEMLINKLTKGIILLKEKMNWLKQTENRIPLLDGTVADQGILV